MASSTRLGFLVLLTAVLSTASIPALAKNIGGEPFCLACCTCGQASSDAPGGDGACPPGLPSAGSACVHPTKATLNDSYPVLSATAANGTGLDLSLHYASYNADGEKATIEGVLGYGWSHSYNIYLFKQRYDWFKMSPAGLTTKYEFKRVGRRGGYYRATRGNRQEVRYGSDWVEIENFEGGLIFRFEDIPGNPLRVAGRAPLMLTRITDRNGNVTTLHYTDQPNGLLDRVEGPYGREIRFAYNAQNRIVKITDPAGRETTLDYDAAGNLSRITDPIGQTTRYDYNVRHQITRKTDRNGHDWHYDYDEDAHPVAIADANGDDLFRMRNTARWATDLDALFREKLRICVPATTTVTDGRGYEWTYSYNEDCQITETQAPDNPPGTPPATYTYEPNYLNIESVTDHNEHTTGYEYFPNGNLKKATDAKGHETSYTYADTSRPMDQYDGPNCPDLVHEVFHPSGSKTEHEYDPTLNARGSPRCNRIKETRDVGGLDLMRQWTYDPDGNLATETDPKNHVTRYEYDPLGNRIEAKDPEDNVTRYGYNNPEVPADPDYEKLGNRTCMVDGNGHVDVSLYDLLDWLKEEIAKIGTTVDPGDDIEPACTPADSDYIVTAKYDYDGEGNQTLVRRQESLTAPTDDDDWQNTTYEYDYRDRLVKETQDLGGLDLVTTHAYDGNDNRISTTDPIGNATGDPSNHTTFFQYDAQNRLTKVTDALDYETSYGYDPVGNRIEEIDANGHRTCSQYDELDRLTVQIRKMGPTSCALTAPNDLVTRHFYDTGATDPCSPDPGSPQCAGPTPGSGDIAYSVDPEQRHTHYKYDKVDRRWVTIRKVAPYIDNDGMCDGDDWCEYTKYDDADNVVARIDANGNRTCYQYDQADRLTVEIQKMGSTSCALTAFNDLITSYSYDGADNVVEVTSPRGNTAINTYDERDQILMIVDDIGKVAEYKYDGIGNRIIERDGNQGDDNPDTDDLAPEIVYVYDKANRLEEVVDAMGESTFYRYDDNGNLIDVTDREDHVTCHYYDPINRRIRTAELMGGANCALLSFKDIWTDTEYDDVGNVSRLITARLNSTPRACKGGTPPDDCQITAYDYDAADRLILETYADETTREFSYDKAGNLTGRVDQLGQQTRYLYNDLYYLEMRDYQDPNEPDDSFECDVGGRMTVATKDYPDLDPRPDWVVTFDAYDPVNRLLQTTQDFTGSSPMVVVYSYDTPDGLRELTYPDLGGRTCVEQMDLRERLVDVTCDSFSAEYAYDLGNRVDTREYNNGVTADYDYNDNDWITELVHADDGTEIADFRYDYDKEGSKLFEEKSPALLAGQSEAYAYDPIYRLIDYRVGDLVGSTVPLPITQREYDLDKVGNWDQFTVDDDGAGPGVPVDYNNTPNQMNEYDDWSTNGPGAIPDDLGLDINFADPVPTPPEDGENWAHDKNGNRREDGKRSYEYDDENRLVLVTYKPTPLDPTLTTRYQYDALGRRVRKEVDIDGNYGAPTETRYAYDDARAIEEQDALGATLATYVYGNYIDEVLNMQRGGVDYYYHQNALWSVAAVTDALANVLERYAYTDYGCPTITDGTGAAVAPNAWGTAHSAIGNPYLFTGRRWDEESGLYFYRARYYDCEGGRFLQRDLLEFLDGMSSYEYVKGNPIRYKDPSGHIRWEFSNVIQDIVGKVTNPALKAALKKISPTLHLSMPATMMII